MTITADNTLEGLGFDTQAPAALADAGITTVGQLLAHTRDRIAVLPGMGAARLADLDVVMSRHGLAYGRRRIWAAIAPTCTSCPHCPNCGNRRGQDRRHIGIDVTGRASHLGHRVGPTCDGCHAHHLGLFTTPAG